MAIHFQEGGNSASSPLEIPASLLKDPSLLWEGLPFAAALLSILFSHEMGHYLACRYYKIRATPPYFIPLPLISLVGTLGAFIRIRSPFPSRRSLFDVGVAGPIAGFLVLLPALVYGIRHSMIATITASDTILSFDNFGQPFLFRWIWLLFHPPHQQGMQIINLHPIAWAGWFGLLATFLNLLPIGQLDGGHVLYALFGSRWHRRLSLTMLAVLAGFSAWGMKDSSLPIPPYLVFAVILILIGLRHPQTLDDEEPAGRGRYYVGALALIILIGSFIPVPIILR